MSSSVSTRARPNGARCRLYLITPPDLDARAAGAFAPRLAEALDAGDVACVQLRIKDADDDGLRRACDALRPVAQTRDVAFVLNDRPDLAAETGCDGVHVGQQDTPPSSGSSATTTADNLRTSEHSCNHSKTSALNKSRSSFSNFISGNKENLVKRWRN